jgi:hypothetical protein
MGASRIYIYKRGELYIRKVKMIGASSIYTGRMK